MTDLLTPDTIPLIATVVALVITTIAGAINQAIELRKLKAELQGRQVVLKDTGDLRELLAHGLEGTWHLKGEFDRFQGQDKKHYSSGYLVLDWIPPNKKYEAIYIYSVREEYGGEPQVTAMCRGHSEGDVSRGRASQICFNFQTEARTAAHQHSMQTTNFRLVAKYRRATRQEPEQVTVDYHNDRTRGQLVFRR